MHAKNCATAEWAVFLQGLRALQTLNLVTSQIDVYAKTKVQNGTSAEVSINSNGEAMVLGGGEPSALFTGEKLN